MTEGTLALIKSSALHRKQDTDIMFIATNAGLLIARRSLIYGEKSFLDLYAEHAGKEYFERLIASVSDGAIAVLLEGDDAVARWRAIIGPSDPAVARQTAPESIRARFGTELPDNAVHGSDSKESAVREIAIFFDRSN